MTDNKYQFYLIIIFVFLSLSGPNITPFANSFSIRVEDFILAALSMLTVAKGSKNADHSNRLWPKFVLVEIFICISLFFQILRNNEIIIRDFFIMILTGKYFLIFYVMKSAELDIWQFKAVLISFIMGVITQVIISFMQYYNLFDINYYITPLITNYSDRVLSLIESWHVRRVLGLVGNPNYLCFIMVIGSIVCICIVLSKFLHKFKYLLLICFVTICWNVFTTLSRAGIITFFMSLFTIMFLFIIKRGNLLGIVLLLSFLTVLTFMSSITTDIYFERSYKWKGQAGIEARFHDMTYPFLRSNNSLSQILVGNGPSKSNDNRYIHNEFGWVFDKFGLLGLLIYLMIYCFFLWKFIKEYYKEKHFIYRPIIGIATMVAWIVFAQSAVIYTHMQSMAITLMLLGMLSAPLPHRQPHIQILKPVKRLKTI